MNNIGAMIQQEIDQREAEIVGFETAIEEARGFVARLRQALAVLRGEASTTSLPGVTADLHCGGGVKGASHSARNAPRKAASGKGARASAAARKEHDRVPEEDLCGCGRARRHKGRCSARRRNAQHFESSTSSRAEAKPLIPQPLRAKNTTEFQKAAPPASQPLKEVKAVRSGQTEKKHSCGHCVTRIINGTPMLSAQPDCPEHGLGFGMAQPGREQKAAQPIAS